MRYLTHQFAHVETLERARRWLIHAGFDPNQIEVITHGIPRIAVRLGPGQAAEAELVIDAVELTDPQGNPSFWELARQHHVYPNAGVEATETSVPRELMTLVVGDHPEGERLKELVDTISEAELREGYLGRGI